MKLILDDEERKDLHNVIHDSTGLDLTPEQLDDVIANPRVMSELTFGLHDTATREAVGNFLAKKIVGRAWPTYGEGEATRSKFYEDFKREAPLKGFSLRG